MNKEQQLTVERSVSTLGVVGYRYLAYGWVLSDWKGSDEEFERLTEQQARAEKELKMAVTTLTYELGEEAATVFADMTGVMSQLVAYTYASRSKEEISREEHLEKVNKILDWVRNSTFITEGNEIANASFTDKEVKEYEDFRENQWAAIGTYLRTMTLDFVYDTKRQDVPEFAAGLSDVKAYMAMLDENSMWTSMGIEYVVMSSAKYDHDCNESNHAVAGFAQDLVAEWIKDGQSIIAEYRK